MGCEGPSTFMRWIKFCLAHLREGIVVSNHAGRQVDGAIASLDALPPIVEAVGDQLTIIYDSGIRTGADVFKAMALGAKAVLFGRMWIYGASPFSRWCATRSLGAQAWPLVDLAACTSPRAYSRCASSLALQSFAQRSRRTSTFS